MNKFVSVWDWLNVVQGVCEISHVLLKSPTESALREKLDLGSFTLKDCAIGEGSGASGSARGGGRETLLLARCRVSIGSV